MTAEDAAGTVGGRAPMTPAVGGVPTGAARDESFGPDTVPVALLRWTIPWQGRTATLEVQPALTRREASVHVDGAEVGRFRRPTMQSPWVECVLQPAGPSIKLVEIAYPRAGLIPPRERYRTLVFVDGVSVTDGRTEAEWRAATPAPIDDFEVQFGHSRLFSVVGAAGLATAIALCAVPAWLAGGNPIRDAWAPGIIAAAWVVVFAWVMLMTGLVRLLVRRPAWPSALRRMAVICVFCGVPVVLILLAKNLTGAS